MVISKKTIIFQDAGGEGVQLIPWGGGGGGGVQLLIPIETYRRGSGPPLPPLGLRMIN